MEQAHLVVIEYTNYRGERSFRTILPGRIWYGQTEYHSSQWLLDAQDVAKGAERTFAIADIHSWRPASGGSTTGKDGDEHVSA